MSTRADEPYNKIKAGIKQFWHWITNGRGVEYQVICEEFQKNLYGRRNDYKLFRDELFDRTENSNIRLSNLYKNFNGGAGFEINWFLNNIPKEDKDLIRPSIFSWCYDGDDAFKKSNEAARYIIRELKFWQDMDNEQKKHVLKVAKNWYQKSRTNNNNANDYLAAAEQLMCGINVGGTIKTRDGKCITTGGFIEHVKAQDLYQYAQNYETAYKKPGFDPIKYIEELEQDIANEEKKGKTGLVSDKHPEVKEIPDELPSDNKKTPTTKNTSSSQKTDDKKPSQRTMTPEERKASVEKGKEIWAKFMETEGKKMLEKLREKNAQKGVSARGLTSRLKRDSDKAGNMLSDNAEEIVETKEIVSASVDKTR